MMSYCWLTRQHKNECCLHSFFRAINLLWKQTVMICTKLFILSEVEPSVDNSHMHDVLYDFTFKLPLYRVALCLYLSLLYIRLKMDERSIKSAESNNCMIVLIRSSETLRCWIVIKSWSNFKALVRKILLSKTQNTIKKSFRVILVTNRSSNVRMNHPFHFSVK